MHGICQQADIVGFPVPGIEAAKVGDKRMVVVHVFRVENHLYGLGTGVDARFVGTRPQGVFVPVGDVTESRFAFQTDFTPFGDDIVAYPGLRADELLDFGKAGEAETPSLAGR